LTLVSQLSRTEYRALLKLLEYLIHSLFELSLKCIGARFSFSVETTRSFQLERHRSMYRSGFATLASYKDLGLAKIYFKAKRTNLWIRTLSTICCEMSSAIHPNNIEDTYLEQKSADVMGWNSTTIQSVSRWRGSSFRNSSIMQIFSNPEMSWVCRIVMFNNSSWNWSGLDMCSRLCARFRSRRRLRTVGSQWSCICTE